jgi:hypothetical protein
VDELWPEIRGSYFPLIEVVRNDSLFGPRLRDGHSVVRQLEPIVPRWQDSPGNLDRLAEREPGRPIPIICMHYWEHDGERKH